MKQQTTLTVLLAASCAMLIAAGCSRDVHLAGKDIPHAAVKAVSHYGQTLDQSATPEQVTYVALRAIRDDLQAATREGRQQALDVQFDVCAANVIANRNRGRIARDEFIYNVVYHWTPTVSHYVQNFDFNWDEARQKLVRRDLPAGTSNGAEQCEVRMELEAPSGDPNARVVMIVWLAKDKGYWRVVHLGFDNATRSLQHAGLLPAQETSDDGT